MQQKYRKDSLSLFLSLSLSLSLALLLPLPGVVFFKQQKWRPRKRESSTLSLMHSLNPPSKGTQLLYAFLTTVTRETTRGFSLGGKASPETVVMGVRKQVSEMLNSVWFTPVAEVDLCGHATLASAHVLFSTGLIGSETVEFATRSGILTATKQLKNDDDEEESPPTFSIELDFPVVPTFQVNYVDDDLSLFSKAMNGATIVDVKATEKDILLVLSSWESVVDLQPRLDEISKCPCEGMMVTAAASPGSTFDFCSRYFAPRLGVNEDPVTGSAHCALAHYWNLKMNKCDFLAYQASSRGGTVKVHLDKEKQRVLLRGKAITVMEGCVLV